MVTLEALKARKGDALLLRRANESGRDSLVVIDGGAGGVFKSSLKPRLDALRAAEPRDDDGQLPTLRIDAVIVSHIDDDHIAGLLDLTDHMLEQPQVGNRDYAISLLWHNSFDTIASGAASALAIPDSGEVDAASADELMEDFPVSADGALLLASVPQGRRLTDNARGLRIRLNSPWNTLITADHDRRAITIAPGIAATVLWPSPGQLQELQAAWAKVEKKEKLEAAAFTDDKVWNLSSIVVLVETDGKTMLLTGDARGDHVLEGAHAMGLLTAEAPTLRVDVLKVPHHGSNRSNDTPLFDAFPADHYVISGNGEHGNPSVETVKALIESRRKTAGPFTIYFTYHPDEFRPHRGHAYPADELKAVLDGAKNEGVPLTIVTPQDRDLGVTVQP